jgi:hypothetical protein
MEPVSILVEDSQLIVIYGDDERTIVMELETDAERELVQRLLEDGNFWTNFLSSLSAALNPDNQGVNIDSTG